MASASAAAKGSRKAKQKVSTDLAIGMVLDRSYSIAMNGLTGPMIDGFNTYLSELREQEGETFFSLTLFNTDFERRYVGVPLAKVEDLTRETFVPDGNTALYDAIAFTVKDLEKRLKKQGREDTKVLIVTMTDGEENSSTDYDAVKLADLVRQYEAKGNWTFVYLGLGQTREYVSRLSGVGYTADNASYPVASAGAVQDTYSGMGRATSTLRSSAKLASANFMADAGINVNADGSDSAGIGGERDKTADPKSETGSKTYTEGGLLDHLTGGQ